MKKLFLNKLLALWLIFACLTALCTNVLASQTTNAGTTWYGDEITAEIKAGKNGYTFVSSYADPGLAYEVSNHVITRDGGATSEIAQTSVLVNADKDYTWTPNGTYALGKSNYDVLYCCDSDTAFKDGVYYRRTGLENSNYYSAEDAAHIRAIVLSSYPYLTLEQMKTTLKNAGVEDAEKFTRSEIITAVQAAIWSFSNEQDYVYDRSCYIPQPAKLALHDHIAETPEWIRTGKPVLRVDSEASKHISSLIEYLKNLEAVHAEDELVLTADVEIDDCAPIVEKPGYYTADINVTVNSSDAGDGSDINVSVYVDGELRNTQKLDPAKSIYTFTEEVAVDKTIKAVVSGTQILPKGVYFYEPEGGREVSQCLVGVDEGETSVYAEDETVFRGITIPEYNNNYAYIFGHDDITMAAEHPLLRSEVSAIIHRLVKQNNMLGDFVYDETAQPVFSDIGGTWYRSAIEFMNYKGAFDVAPGGKVQGETAITRGEAFKMVCIGLGFTDKTDLSHEQYAIMLKDAGFIVGDGSGNLNLDSIIKRCEFCTVYNKVIGRENAKLELADGTKVTAATYGFTDLSEDAWYYEIMMRATSAYDNEGYVSLELRGIRNNLDDYN